MIVFRIAKDKYAHDLSGRGAEKAGGRWNCKGYPVLYTCESRALAAVEFAVHTSLGFAQDLYRIVTIEIPEDPSIYSISEKDLPDEWRQFPFPKSTQNIGTNWLRSSESLLMKVPSVVVQGDYNILVNPFHEDFKTVKIIASSVFNFDRRLYKES